MRVPLSAEALSDLIGAIYDCALEPGRWLETLTKLYLELDFANAALTLVALPSGAMLLDLWAGPDPSWIACVAQYSPDGVEAWGGAEKMQSFALEQPYILSRETPRQELENNRFYRDWLRPQGIHDAIALMLTRDSTLFGGFGLGRHESAGEIGDLEIAAVRLLAPHLRRAATISRLLEVKSVVAATLESALDGLAVGVVLTDAGLRIVHANQAAAAMLTAGDPILSRRGTLTITSPPAATALAVAVLQAAEDESAIGKRGLGIPLFRANGEPCVIHVLPLKHGELRPDLAPSAVAAIFVAPAVSPPPAPADALAELFDLTPAEARVFALVADGTTQHEIARVLEVEPGTVKTHLLRIFAKTGAHRQTDLIKLAAGVTLPLQA